MPLSTVKWASTLCFVVAMVVLMGGGVAMKKELPPYPGKVVDPDGNALIEKSDIIAIGVLPRAYFLITTYPHLKPAETKNGESVWERLGIELEDIGLTNIQG